MESGETATSKLNAAPNGKNLKIMVTGTSIQGAADKQAQVPLLVRLIRLVRLVRFGPTLATSTTTFP